MHYKNRRIGDVFFLFKNAFVSVVTLLLVDTMPWFVFVLEKSAVEKSTKMDQCWHFFVFHKFCHFLDFLWSVGISRDEINRVGTA